MVHAVILAGGRGTRLGGCFKPLLPLGKGTILDEILARLVPQATRIALSMRAAQERTDFFDGDILQDRYRDTGPLAGILSALEWAHAHRQSEVLTVAGDTPFIPRDLVRVLGVAPACAQSGGRVHSLTALWPVSSLGRLRHHIDDAVRAGDRRALSIRSFAVSIGMRPVCFEIAQHDPFFNVNTPEDHALLASMVPTHGQARPV